MLTVEQVKEHSFVTVSNEGPWMSLCENPPRVRGVLCYQFAGKLHKLGMSFPIEHHIDVYAPDAEDVCRQGIDWQRFTDWLNKHDDMTESDLLSREQYSELHVAHKDMRGGRNGDYDTRTDKVKDYNRTILV